jgi:hypothetical protein
VIRRRHRLDPSERLTRVLALPPERASCAPLLTAVEDVSLDVRAQRSAAWAPDAQRALVRLASRSRSSGPARRHDAARNGDEWA